MLNIFAFLMLPDKKACVIEYTIEFVRNEEKNLDNDKR